MNNVFLAAALPVYYLGQPPDNDKKGRGLVAFLGKQLLALEFPEICRSDKVEKRAVIDAVERLCPLKLHESGLGRTVSNTHRFLLCHNGAPCLFTSWQEETFCRPKKRTGCSTQALLHRHIGG